MTLSEINITTVLTAISALFSVVVSLLAYLTYKSLQKKNYDYEKKQVRLDERRENIEDQIYALNERLLKNEDRWRDVNHLLLQKTYLENPVFYENREIHFSEFLKANGLTKNDLNINNRLVFVLTPFNSEFHEDFVTIRETCSRLGLRCIRGDEEFFKGDIFPEMLKYISQARVVIANINGRSPNVLYELGIAQAMDKLVILVSRDPSNLPVDVKSQRFLIYKDYNSLSEMLHNELQKVL
ncbi:MAG: hypothetical protein JSS76_17785 [Bacteroidetes bacterium]|nr:hypothetical protein [Bacteroidota bacterium]